MRMPWKALTVVAALAGSLGVAQAEVTIRAFCLCGNVSITVPDDMDVDVSGVGFMGSFDHHASGAGVPGTPRLRVVGFALLGSVDVRRKSAQRDRPELPST